MLFQVTEWFEATGKSVEWYERWNTCTLYTILEDEGVRTAYCHVRWSDYRHFLGWGGFYEPVSTKLVKTWS